MEIIDYDQNHLDELTRIYNTLTASIPHCYAIEPSELAEAFAGACGLESHGQRLTMETVFVAQEAGKPLGFAHVGEGFSKEIDGEAGVIRFLAYPRGRRDIGQGLLSRAEQWLVEREQGAVFVFPQAYRYPFYAFPHAFVSNRLEHVQALLLFNGYQASNGEIFLDWPDFDPEPPDEVSDPDIEVTVALEPNAGQLPNVTVSALQGVQQIGICKLLNARGFSRQPEAKDTIFCMWLWVDDLFQGNRLGQMLLARGLAKARRIGYRHAAISTAWDNHRALLFYSNHGFHAVDWTVQYRKTL